MAKVIDDTRKQMIAVARTQVLELGYANVTIRSVASACGVAVGTIYNYFKSKDELVDAFLLEDWDALIRTLEQELNPKLSAAVAMEKIYSEIYEYGRKYGSIFFSEKGGKISTKSYIVHHRMMMDMLKPILVQHALHCAGENEFAADYLTEAVLHWAPRHIDFQTFWAVISKAIVSE